MNDLNIKNDAWINYDVPLIIMKSLESYTIQIFRLFASTRDGIRLNLFFPFAQILLLTPRPVHYDLGTLIRNLYIPTETLIIFVAAYFHYFLGAHALFQ